MHEIRLGEAQIIQTQWEQALLGDEITPLSRIERFEEEANELLSYKDEERLLDGGLTPELAREVGEEAIDVVILALSIINSLGYNAENLFWEKMEKNYRKYSPVAMNRLLVDGYSRSEALELLKRQWEER